MIHRRYIRIILGIYVALLPLFFIFDRPLFQFGFSLSDWPGILLVLIIVRISIYWLFGQSMRIQTEKVQFPLLAYVFIIALAEEIIFRGFIQGYLTKFFPIIIAILFSSVLFGFAHLLNGAISWRKPNWTLAYLAFLAGLPLGTLYALTNSLLTPLLLHLIFLLLPDRLAKPHHEKLHA